MSPESFWRVMWANPREPLLVLVSGALGIGWGGSTLLGENPAWERLLGAFGTLCGTLVLASYALRFHRAVLEAEHWSTSRPRRVAKTVLRHAWFVFLMLVFIAAVIELIAS